MQKWALPVFILGLETKYVCSEAGNRYYLAYFMDVDLFLAELLIFGARNPQTGRYESFLLTAYEAQTEFDKVRSFFSWHMLTFFYPQNRCPPQLRKIFTRNTIASTVSYFHLMPPLLSHYATKGKLSIYLFHPFGRQSHPD